MDCSSEFRRLKMMFFTGRAPFVLFPLARSMHVSRSWHPYACICVRTDHCVNYILSAKYKIYTFTSTKYDVLLPRTTRLYICLLYSIIIYAGFRCVAYRVNRRHRCPNAKEARPTAGRCGEGCAVFLVFRDGPCVTWLSPERGWSGERLPECFETASPHASADRWSPGSKSRAAAAVRQISQIDAESRVS